MGNESYREGYVQGVRDFAERLKKFYHHLAGKTISMTVEYHIDQVANEMLKEDK